MCLPLVHGCRFNQGLEGLEAAWLICLLGGLLRLAAAALLLTIGPGVLGWPAWFIGSTDLAWGLIYTFGLPRFLETTHKKLLFDVSGA